MTPGRHDFRSECRLGIWSDFAQPFHFVGEKAECESDAAFLVIKLGGLPVFINLEVGSTVRSTVNEGRQKATQYTHLTIVIEVKLFCIDQN